MFLLKNLPTDRELTFLADRYPGMNPNATRVMLLLMRVGSEASHAFEAMLKKDGLSQGRFLALMVLNRNPENRMSPTDLAASQGVTPPTMTGLMDGLEKDGLIHRASSPDDRRKLMVSMTPKGHDLLDAILPDYYAMISGVLSNLTEMEQQQLAGLIIKAFQDLAPASK